VTDGLVLRTSEVVWSERDTTPDAIDQALRSLLRERHAASRCFVPARVLNLVVIADRDWRGEVANRLEGIGRHHPSRTILCTVEAGRRSFDAVVAVSAPEADASTLALGHEHIEIAMGPDHLPHLESLIDPLLITDLTTVLWAPHRHHVGIDALCRLGHAVLIDSVEEPSVEEALARAATLSQEFHVVDLAWLRSAPWRERLASGFDPPTRRPELRRFTAISVRHHVDSGVAALLLVGWLASRLGWRPGAMVRQAGGFYGRARSDRQDIAVRLEPDPSLSIPGLAGIGIETASGWSLSLERGPGGLHATTRGPQGRVSAWTVMGASRGERGILGEGIRQALLRDPTYLPALAVARQLAA
jgi:glucose-6-phosphate dehydrogenase assembly protein OpcA